ncbi:deoxyguanosinetriphosphate triphosphohydrolase [Natronosporangium hydrolyticum]|uniref:Deoxyguanosinetriphosphate triphosphohydrolase-like protein n=1 Tax=Natronosporangium hydrolyticum TaxID=2811111 RepID=A0A895YCU1_9ACTN|nr:deoxyguanosinetriphosphate triphosphohydrolase [Natronosporangium hydrolyticum]QSB13169.1 deoxyguanosinetriphosphate triphosphohydrolase [Natronosporangium hydrolyticum]
MVSSDTQRWRPEPPKDSGSRPVPYQRGPYQRDRARVLHSAGFRRLASKTQVHTAGTGSDAFLRTRLTHSLEVAQIAREMGEHLGCDPDVVDTAGLAHDLGHPPFGHNGEHALNQVAAECGGFEGNAQTLRVLTRLEAKIPGAGLNLTRASLDATCKYPWFRRDGERKFGVYADDVEVFEWLRAATPPAEPDRRCLEAQVMDWADDVAYSVHDVEDGFHSGYVSLGPLLADADERAALCADVARVYSPESADDLAEPLAELLAHPVVAPLSDYDGSHAAQAALKRFTSVLTGRFVAAAVAATRTEFGTGPLRRYDADVLVPRLVRAQCALLKGIALRYVMRRRSLESWYSEQRQLLTELVAALLDRAPDRLDPVFAATWKAASDDAARLRVVVDQVASLTDPSAIAWHRELCQR